MKAFLITYMLTCILNFTYCQTKQKTKLDSLSIPNIDSIVQDRLIQLALENPSIKESGHLIKSAEYELKRAKYSWLSSFIITANINELNINNETINGVPASLFFPRYNFGMILPLNIFVKQEKKIANEKVNQTIARSESSKRMIIREVLVKYENYKEKKDLLDIQKQISDSQFSNYQQKQREYSNGEISEIKVVNIEYESWLEKRLQLRTKERDYVISEIELEEIIGMNVAEAIKSLK